MKLRLKHDQFMTLLSLLQQCIQRDMPADITERLVRTVLVRVYKKFYQQAVETKPRYSLSLSPEEAMAFWIYYNGHDLPVTSFEGIVLTTITNSIHQHFVV